MSDFTMPSLGADMDQGTLLEWLVAPGDQVHRGDPVAVVDTSKAAIEVETFVDGVVGELLVAPGTTVAVGTPLARIDGHTPSAPAAPAAPSAPAARVEPAAPARSRPAKRPRKAARATAPPPRATAPSRRPPVHPSVRATPLARRLAEELGVDIETLGTPGGLPIRAGDVRAAAQAPAEAPTAPAAEAPTPPPTTPPTPPPSPTASAPAPAGHQQSMRATIAARMSRSNREIPHYFLSTTVDLDRATRWLRQHNRSLPVAERVVTAALLLKATALAAAATPELNGTWVEDAFRPGDGVQLGVATSLRGGGLLAPVLHDADHLPLDELMRTLRDLVTRARSGRLRATELSDPTLTVTNLGEQGVDSVQGVIYPPQVALVGFGRVADRPVAVDGMLGVHPTTTLTLAADHRATDGFTGSRFLALIDRHLQQPEEL